MTETAVEETATEELPATFTVELDKTEVALVVAGLTFAAMAFAREGRYAAIEATLDLAERFPNVDTMAGERPAWVTAHLDD